MYRQIDDTEGKTPTEIDRTVCQLPLEIEPESGEGTFATLASVVEDWISKKTFSLIVPVLEKKAQSEPAHCCLERLRDIELEEEQPVLRYSRDR